MKGGLSLHDLVAALPIPALAVAQNEEIAALNAEAGNLLGVQGLGRPFITALRQPAVAEAVEACLSNGARSTAEYLTRMNGSDVTFSVTVTSIGEAGAVLVVFQDVSHVNVTGQMRRDFVANVTHELRTPLTALMGFIETLRGPARNDAAARERFLETMAAETERMNRLVGDLLSLSRVEAEERVRPQSEVDGVAVLSSALRSLIPIATDAGVTLVADLPKEGVMIRGDKDQMTQVFTNIIDNAVKYGGGGNTVFVSACVHANAPLPHAPSFVITVRDEGPGIAARHLPRLTERFYRADDHRNRDMGGTGLGLAIVKHILNRHGGRIRFSSKIGQGTEVELILPTA